MEEERRKRIRASLAAYAYEILNSPIMSDADFDALCLSIDPSIRTGKRVLDLFFKTEFNPHTGQWIHAHPQLDLIKDCYERVYTKRSN